MSLDDELTKARKKIVKDGYDMSLGELISMYQGGELIINPDFQRYFRWNESQKTRFIESLLLGIPTPPIFVYMTDEAKWELIDGLQRVSTVLQFTGHLKDFDSLALNGTEDLPSLEGMRWTPSTDDSDDGFSPKQQMELKRVRVRVEILKQESDSSAKYELFQRLNTGGSALSEQEVRTCIMMMIDKSFANWLTSLVSLPAFKNVIAATTRDEQRRQPDELALRFIVLRHVPYERRIDVHAFLSKGMIKLANDTSFNREKERDDFSNVFDLINTAFGGQAFRKGGRGGAGAFMLAAYEIISVGLAENLEKYLAMPRDSAMQVLKAKKAALLASEIFRSNSGAGVRGTTRFAKLLPHAAKLMDPDEA